jgi:hypothetical protein
MVQPHAAKRDYDRAFEGLVYPASLSAVMKAASDRGGLDREVLEMIGYLPDRQYESVEDLFSELRLAYAGRDVPSELIPV